MNSNVNTHAQNEIIKSEDSDNRAEKPTMSEHQTQDAAQEAQHKFEESAQTRENIEEEQDEEEAEEEVDLFAQQKAESVETIQKITNLVTKIEETVARHKMKAECLKLGEENPLVFDQKVYHAAKTNRYDTGMSSELLMKHLMQLDNCLSYGCGTIKTTRKALVCRIKHVMAQADTLSKQWLKRVKVLEKLKAEVPTCVNSDKTTARVDAGEADETTAKEEQTVNSEMDEEQTGNSEVDEEQTDNSEMDQEQTGSNEMDQEQPGSNEMDEEQTGNSDHETNDANDDSAPEMDVEESSDDEMDEGLAKSNVNYTSSPSSSERHAETKQTESAHLPSWQPRTQMYHDNSHVVVAAFVPGMEMDKFNIMIDGTELLITAKKQPTMQDIISCRRGRAPNFGNLDLRIPLPTDVVHTEGATATYEDGILRVKFIKKQRRPARRQAYRQPMHYQQPMYYQQPRRRNFFNQPLSFW